MTVMKNRRPLAIALTVVVAVVAAVGLYLSGSPAAERARKFDQTRVSDLQSISYAIDNYWNVNSRLPATLDELARSRDTYVSSIVDPNSGMPYEFVPATKERYNLCATFDAESSATDSVGAPIAYPAGPTGSPNFWQHGPGRACFTIDVRKNPVPGIK